MITRIKAFSILCLVFVVTVACTATAFAEEPGNPFRGKYRLTLKIGGDWDSASEMTFYLRSSGAAGKIKGKGNFEYGGLSFHLMKGMSSDGPDPLPIGNLIITYGSDAETCELIVRLVKTRDWGPESKIEIMDAVTTFVDGPNETDSWSTATVKLERWDKTTKKWIVLE